MTAEQEVQNLATLTLEKLRFNLKAYVSRELLDEMYIDVQSEVLGNEWAFMVRGHVWSNQIHQLTRREEVPATWWDGVKQAFFPMWLVKRMPIRVRTILTEVKYIHTCPHLNISTPEEERFHLQWMFPRDQYGDMETVVNTGRPIVGHDSRN